MSGTLCGFLSFIECLCTYIVVLVLLHFPMCRRTGSGSRIQLPLLRFGHAGYFFRGDFRLAQTEFRCFFLDLFRFRFQLFLFGDRLVARLFFGGERVAVSALPSSILSFFGCPLMIYPPPTPQTNELS